MSDGSIHFDTTVDTQGVNKASDIITGAFRRMAKEVKTAFGVKDKSGVTNKFKAQADAAQSAANTAIQAYDAQIKKIEELKAEINALNEKQNAEFKPSAELEGLNAQTSAKYKEMKAAQRAYNQMPLTDASGAWNKEREIAGEKLKKLSAEWKALQAQVEALAKTEETQFEKEQSKIGPQIQKAEQKLATEQGKVDGMLGKVEQLNQKAAEAQERLKDAMDSKRPTLFGKAVQGVGGTFKMVTHRVAGLMKRVLIFSVITKALRKMKEALSSLAKSDTQVAGSLQRIKGNLATAFQPLWEAVLPVVRQVVAALEVATAKMAQFTSAIFGKSASQMAKNAQALQAQASAEEEVGEAAEDASKSLAGFDEINQLGSDEKDSSSGSDSSSSFATSDFGELDAKTKKIMAYGTMILGTALLIAGIALVNIPMILAGIALVKAGLAIGKSSGVFDSVPMWVHQIITWGLMIAGTALLVAGIATTNLTMALVGAAMLGVGIGYGSASGAFDAIPSWVNQVITWGLMLTGVVLLIVGIATANIPMIIAGAAALGMGIAYGAKQGVFTEVAAAIARTFDKVRQTVAEKVAIIREWWKANVTPVIQGLKTFFIEIARAIRDGVTGNIDGMKTHLSNAWNAIKTTAVNTWNNIWNGIKGVINKILAGIEKFINGVISGINKLISKLNQLTASMPDWLKEHTPIGNFSVNTLQPVTLPRLASGTVIPANYGEFAAILGDNKREAEVVSPISAMKQAFLEAIAESGAGGNINNITLTIANRVISEAVIEYINGRNRQLGVNVIKE